VAARDQIVELFVAMMFSAWELIEVVCWSRPDRQTVAIALLSMKFRVTEPTPANPPPESFETPMAKQ